MIGTSLGGELREFRGTEEADEGLQDSVLIDAQFKTCPIRPASMLVGADALPSIWGEGSVLYPAS